MSEVTLGDQVSALINENRHLRLKGEADDKTIIILREQYDRIAAEMEAMRRNHEDETRALRIERDTAVRKSTTVQGILHTASHEIIAGLRAMRGDEEPRQIAMEESEPKHWRDQLNETIDASSIAFLGRPHADIP